MITHLSLSSFRVSLNEVVTYQRFLFDFHILFLDVVFPIELHRHQSMQSLRHRRDPHYQGNRIRKAKRVIDKSGEHNIEFVNIPERGWRFFKDFVTTLVISM